MSRLLVFVAATVMHCTLATVAAPRNILLITIDDLRPQLNASYGHPQMHTPNLDLLAAEGTTFRRAYCQQAVCSPSRNSFMSGRRPGTTRVWNFLNHFREVGQNWTFFRFFLAVLFSQNTSEILSLPGRY